MLSLGVDKLADSSTHLFIFSIYYKGESVAHPCEPRITMERMGMGEKEGEINISVFPRTLIFYRKTSTSQKNKADQPTYNSLSSDGHPIFFS